MSSRILIAMAWSLCFFHCRNLKVIDNVEIQMEMSLAIEPRNKNTLAAWCWPCSVHICYVFVCVWCLRFPTGAKFKFNSCLRCSNVRILYAYSCTRTAFGLQRSVMTRGKHKHPLTESWSCISAFEFAVSCRVCSRELRNRRWQELEWGITDSGRTFGFRKERKLHFLSIKAWVDTEYCSYSTQ